jgi:2-oxoglutarate ferredoxin oxidoreductase subunit beta
VARSFSGDKEQLVPIIKAGLAHKGAAFIDVISPCVTFNDHEGSTKSYAYVKDHDEALGEVSFIPFFEDISIEYEPGSTTPVTLHDGSHLYLRKVAENYNPTDKIAATRLLHETAARGEFATGVIYVRPDQDNFIDILNLVDRPLAHLGQDVIRPPKAVLDELMDGLR